MADLTPEQVAVTLAAEVARLRLTLARGDQPAGKASPDALLADPRVRAMLAAAKPPTAEELREAVDDRPALEARMYRMAVDMAADLRRGSAPSA